MLPRSVIVYLTNHCSLKCNHCFLKLDNQLNTSSLSFKKMKELIQDFKKNKVFMVAYTGGDPLLHENLFDILKETYQNGMLPLLGLSGIGITDEIAEDLKKCNIGCVQISLDGSNEKVNSLYRGKETFNKIIQSINILVKHNVKVNAAVCINQENFDDYRNLINMMANDLKIYKLKVVFWKNYTDVKCNFNELTDYQKKDIQAFCKTFDNEDHWIMYPKHDNNELVKTHNSSLIIDAYGDIKHTETGTCLGNINIKMPSFYF